MREAADAGERKVCVYGNVQRVNYFFTNTRYSGSDVIIIFEVAPSF